MMKQSRLNPDEALALEQQRERERREKEAAAAAEAAAEMLQEEELRRRQMQRQQHTEVCGLAVRMIEKYWNEDGPDYGRADEEDYRRTLRTGKSVARAKKDIRKFFEK